MRRFIAWTLTLTASALSVSISTAQAPAARTAPTPGAQPRAGATRAAAPVAPVDPAALKARAAAEARAKADMDQLLNEWEKQSATVKSLQVVFERIDKSIAWGDKVSQGMAMLRSPDLACLQFKHAVPDANGKPTLVLNASGQKEIKVEKEPYQRIVCTGKEVLQYEWDEQTVYVYPLDKEARQKALQQGPLPFLFNMKAAEARQRYDMTLLPKPDAPDDYYIKVIPREEIDKKDFKAAHVWLNKKTFLPSKLILSPVGDKEIQEFKFTLINPNQPIDDKFFAMVVPEKADKSGKWKVIRNPDANAQPGAPKAAQATPKRAAIQQPATKR